MKRTAQLFLFTLLLSIILPACKEDVYMDWKLKNEVWLENNKAQPGIITTPSGLQYKVLYEGWKFNRQPSINSIIRVNYKGSLIDGSVFDSVATGKTIDMYLSGAIKGWKEALPKMYDGANYILYIPSKLGYDTIKSNVEIPPYSTLIFNVTLDSSYN